ncbi:hypothetical protein BV210_02545 [Halorientalis sp. IM1011]|uniref:hypothetical protein n=1 Tax=Halorientalis sp. IM1011 TaxID=1932360 RepID=UPI00097CC611|nr:hypothetical protein [Halorientalis sp. IM1011]AQL44444.1 hypothetical protein BV210_02545 [Halorientalis sp. IM1011]
MTKHTQRHRSTTLPFKYRDTGLDFDLEEYSVDGSKPKELDLKAGQTEVDLTQTLPSPEDEGADDWEKVTLFGRLNVPEETVEAVFPEQERDDPPAKLYVAVRCHETIYRDKTVISDEPTAPDSYNATVRIPKEMVRGTVELRPYLVRTEDGPTDGRYAGKKNFRLASGTIYSVVVDLPPGEQPPAIDGEEVSFSRTPHLPEGDKLYYLDFRNESRPKLWINSDHPRITDILQSQGSVGAEARMRDVILDEISYGVWSQLIVRAACAIDEDGDVEHDWQQTVVDTFARNLYEVDDVSEAAHMLRADVSDPEALPHLMDRIDRELQEYIDPRTQLINLMEEGLRI